MNNNIIAFIPARGGSKSIPRKNIKELGGKPLIVYSIETAFKSGLQRVIVSTEDNEIAKIAKEYGAEVLMRPTDLAKDDTSMYQVLKSEVPKISPIPEIVVLLTPTSPFRKSVQVKTAISFFTNNLDNYDSLMSVKRVPDEFNPAQILVNTQLGLRMASGIPLSNRITRRQDYPNAYVTNSGIYIFKTSNLEKGSFYGDKTMLFECDENVDINSPEDWIEAEKQIKKHD